MALEALFWELTGTILGTMITGPSSSKAPVLDDSDICFHLVDTGGVNGARDAFKALMMGAADFNSFRTLRRK